MKSIGLWSLLTLLSLTAFGDIKTRKGTVEAFKQEKTRVGTVVNVMITGEAAFLLFSTIHAETTDIPAPGGGKLKEVAGLSCSHDAKGYTCSASFDTAGRSLAGLLYSDE